MINAPRNNFSGQAFKNLFVMLLGALAVAMVAGGCGKKAPSAAAVDQPVAQAQTTQDTGQPANPQPVPLPTAAPAALPPEPTLPQINHAYIGWIIQTHRHAKTFEEFATASGIQVPPPPSGQKYIIDKHGYVALVTQ